MASYLWTVKHHNNTEGEDYKKKQNKVILCSNIRGIWELSSDGSRGWNLADSENPGKRGEERMISSKRRLGIAEVWSPREPSKEKFPVYQERTGEMFSISEWGWTFDLKLISAVYYCYSPPNRHAQPYMQQTWSAGALGELKFADVHAQGEEMKGHAQFPLWSQWGGTSTALGKEGGPGVVGGGHPWHKWRPSGEMKVKWRQ